MLLSSTFTLKDVLPPNETEPPFNNPLPAFIVIELFSNLSLLIEPDNILLLTCPQIASVPSEINTLSTGPIKYLTGPIPFPINREPLSLFKFAAITAPAASTLTESVTSAFSSILVNFVLSAFEIILPEPELVISDKEVTLLVVYIPFVTVSELPSIFADNKPFVYVMSPVFVPVSVVVPITNLSSDSSHPINKLSPVEPLSIIIPVSFVFSVFP